MLNFLFAPWRTDLALDLGTTSTLICIPGEGVVLDEPSVVAVADESRRVLSKGCAVGQLAQQLLGRSPQSIQVIRPLREGVIADFDLCEAMLRYFLRKAQRRGWKLRPRVLVVSPEIATPFERRALIHSVERAGAGEVLLVGEATAAAIGAGLPLAEPTASIVCDIGGGTTDVAVFALGEVVARHSARIGGSAFDRALNDYLRRSFSLRVGTATAEQLRIEIGSAYPLDEELVSEVRGVDTVSGMPRKALVTSEEVREAFTQPLQDIVWAIKTALDGCTTELVADLLENGMVLTGGGALLRSLDRFLAEQTGLPTRVCPEPLSAAARGAAMCLQHLDRWSGVIHSSDEV